MKDLMLAWVEPVLPISRWTTVVTPEEKWTKPKPKETPREYYNKNKCNSPFKVSTAEHETLMSWWFLWSSALKLCRMSEWINHLHFCNKLWCVLTAGPVVPPQCAVLLVQGEWPGQDAPVSQGGPPPGQPHLPGLLQQRRLPLSWQRAPTGRQTHIYEHSRRNSCAVVWSTSRHKRANIWIVFADIHAWHISV